MFMIHTYIHGALGHVVLAGLAACGTVADKDAWVEDAKAYFDTLTPHSMTGKDVPPGMEWDRITKENYKAFTGRDFDPAHEKPDMDKFSWVETLEGCYATPGNERGVLNRRPSVTLEIVAYEYGTFTPPALVAKANAAFEARAAEKAATAPAPSTVQ